MFIQLTRNFMNPIPRKGHPIKPENDKEAKLKALGFNINPNRAQWECQTYLELTIMMQRLTILGFNSGVVSWQ